MAKSVLPPYVSLISVSVKLNSKIFLGRIFRSAQLSEAPQKVNHMVGILLFFARALVYLLGGFGLFLSLLFFFANRQDRKTRLLQRSPRNTWVSENPPLEVSRHG
jgi:hypothetical protein